MGRSAAEEKSTDSAAETVFQVHAASNFGIIGPHRSQVLYR